MRIEQAGDASSTKALNKSFSDDFAKARTLSLPITLLILVVAFGALVAAGIPVLLAGTGVAATLGLIALVSQIAAVDQVVSETVLLIGMAVGVDYSLFYMRREREERAAGRDEQAALEAAASTSGRSVLVSGLTVMAAMAGMYLAGNKTFASMATGTIMVVAVAVLGSLTVLPALLSKLGDRVMKGRVPFVARRRESGSEPRLWSAVVDRVLRRPLASVLVSGGLVVALAIPAFGLHTSLPGLQGLPSGLPIVKTLNRIETAFPGGPLPAYVVIQGDNVTSPQVQTAINSLERQALATGQIHQPFKVQVNDRHDVAVVSMPLSGKGTDSASYRALDTLRNDVIPATIGSGRRDQGAGDGHDCTVQGFQRLDVISRPDRVRVRADDGVPAAAGDVPLDRPAAHRDRAEPAVRRRRLRRPGARLPAHLGARAAGLQVHRRGHLMAAAVPVRDPVRPLDGLPRVHHQPDPRGVRQGHADRRGHRTRDQVDRRPGDQRGDRDGRSVRDLRRRSARSSSSNSAWGWRWRS